MVQGPCTGLIIVYEQYTCPQNRKRRIEKVKKKKQLSYDDYFEEESDGTFYFVAGYTSGGAPYGKIWEEILASELILRAAVKNDAKPAAELIRVANGDIAELLTGKTKPQNVRDTLALYFREDINRFSYKNIWIASVMDKVAGLVITYPGEDAARLDKTILNRLRKKQGNPLKSFDQEADEKDYYIDTLSVHPKFQGHGIGTALIKKAETVAKEKGYKRISLNVAHGNVSAKHLYKKLGYTEEKVIQINKHNYDYMVKILGD